MSKRDEFVLFINRFKAVSPTISEEQRKGLLRQATQEYEITTDEADEILRESGLIVGDRENYFTVFGLTVESPDNMGEDAFITHVEQTHKELYTTSLRAGGLPRPDGRTQEQWRTLLNQTRDVLIDRTKRNEYITFIQNDTVEKQIGKDSSLIYELSDPDETTHQKSDRNDNKDDLDPYSDMVLIPAGEFVMGSNGIESTKEENPVHSVHVDPFYMDKYPVTNAQYKEFINANPQWRNLGLYNIQLILRKYRDSDYLKNWFKDNYPSGKDDHPVNWVSWHAAMAYAKWVGKRLPTEAEWEKAARGGLVSQKYPWGDTIDTGNVNFDNRVGETTSVGKYPTNGYGLCDIVGNVSEWCLDVWDSEFYKYAESHNPISGGSIESILDISTKSKKYRVIRGGSWFSADREVRVSYRDRLAAWKTSSRVGFRCVKPI